MYFSFFKLKKWGKKTAAARRHNCAALPYICPSAVKKVLDKRTAVVYSVHKLILKPLRRK